MNTLQKTLAVLALSVASLSTASARDSFSLGINIGGYGYAPPVVQYHPAHYYPAPTTVYYGAPTVYYGAPAVRYVPTVSYQYYDHGRRGHHDHGNRWNPRGGHHGGQQHWDRGRDHGDRGHDRGRHGDRR